MSKGEGNDGNGNKREDDPPKPVIIPEKDNKDKDIIKILRDDTNFNLSRFFNEWCVNWMELINLLCEFIKRCNKFESMNRVEALRYVNELNSIRTMYRRVEV
jgi:hypothetical protein